MKYTRLLTTGGLVFAGALLVSGVAFAQTMPPQAQGGHGFGMGGSGFAAAGFRGAGSRAPGVAGKVSSINGTTITLTSNGFGGFGRAQSSTTTATAVTTYTVDASAAKVMKNGTSSTLSAVSVGDMLFVQGTVSGTNVTATTILDGMPMGGFGGGMRGPKNASGTWIGGNGSSTMPRRGTPQNVIQGNGQPVVGGNVSAINGDTLTVVTLNNAVTYTIDATNATIEKAGATSTIASIAVGDNVLVQGSVSGTSVTATSVIDQGVLRTPSSTPGFGGNTGGAKGLGGFMSAIGGFFHHLFGFF